ncbi:recombination mediator RecR [Mycoplasmatota bacterium]|nr:recombination mediator RecR [Mycoplasmatota bacterium]
MKYPRAITELIECFSKYPGIGPKTAERLSLYTVNKIKKEEIDKFTKALIDTKDTLFHCPICGNITDTDPCYICNDKNRDTESLLVVEEAKDVIIIEKMKKYDGKYHVLNGVISPINGVGPEDINLRSLLERLQDKRIKELILGLNASIEGEATSMYIKRLLKNSDIKVTKLAHGLPVGGDLQYADEITLLRALEGRREI